MNVLFVTQYGYLAASSRTRVFQYLPLLRAQGINADVLTVLPDLGITGSQVLVTANRWRKLLYYSWAAWRTVRCGVAAWWRLARYDLLFVQKIIFPVPIRWLLARKQSRTIYDFDDAIFTTEVRRSNWLSVWKEQRNAAGLPAVLRMADRVLVENEYTREYAARFCSSVDIITGPIDTRRFVRSGSPQRRADGARLDRERNDLALPGADRRNLTAAEYEARRDLPAHRGSLGNQY